MKILALNGGSSTLKATLRELDGNLPSAPPPPLWEAQADWGRQPGKAQIRVRAAGEVRSDSEVDIETPAAVLEPVLAALWSGPAKAVGGPGEIDVVGHRVVHGGHAYHARGEGTDSQVRGIRPGT